MLWSFRRLRAFAISPHPGVHGFPVRRLLCPIRLLPGQFGFRWGLPYLLPTPLGILWEVSRVHHVGLKQDGVGSAFLMAPSALCGLPVPAWGTQVHPCSLPGNEACIPCRALLSKTISGLTGWHLRQGMPGYHFPVGLFALQVIYHAISQPSVTSWVLVFPS